MLPTSQSPENSLQELRERVLPTSLRSIVPFTIDRALGASLWDVDGRHYIDFVGGIGVHNIGHNHPRVVDAIKTQADRFIHTSVQVVAYESYIRLAHKLTQLVNVGGSAKAALFNTGVEAVENAIKFAKAYTGRSGVIAFNDAFHGRTHYGLALTGKEMPYKRGFGPHIPDVFHARYPYPYRCPRRACSASGQRCSCSEEIEQIFSTSVAAEGVAAIIFEPVLGEGGFIPADQDFVDDVRSMCDRHGIVMIVDEVQTGFGRTGTMFAIEQYGVTPDIVVAAKSLGGGMPLSAVIGRRDILDSVHAGGIGGTFAGNPLSCAAALAVLDVFEEEDVLTKARLLGERLSVAFKALEERFEVVGEVRGLGAMMALEFVTDRESRKPASSLVGAIIEEGHNQGIVLMSSGRHGNVIRCLVPLTVNDEELEEGLLRFTRTIETCVAQHP